MAKRNEVFPDLEERFHKRALVNTWLKELTYDTLLVKRDVEEANYWANSDKIFTKKIGDYDVTFNLEMRHYSIGKSNFYFNFWEIIFLARGILDDEGIKWTGIGS